MSQLIRQFGMGGGNRGGGYSANAAFNDRVAARKAREMQRVSEEAINNQAQMAVNQLWELGPEGQQWANRIAADPRAGMALLEQYGGLGGVDTMIRRATAANAEAQATGKMLGPMELQAWRMGGPQALQMLASAGYDDAQSRALNVETDILQGSADALATGPDGSVDPLKRARYLRALQHDDPVKVQTEIDRIQYGASSKELNDNYEKRRKDYAVFPILEESYDGVMGADVSKPEDVIYLVNVYQRMIDDAVVRSDDVKLLEAATASGWEQIKAQALSFFNARKALPAGMGEKLKSAAIRVLNNRGKAAIRMAQDDRARANELGWTPRGITKGFPYQRQVDAAIERFTNPRTLAQIQSDEAGAAGPQRTSGLKVMRGPNGDLIKGYMLSDGSFEVAED